MKKLLRLYLRHQRFNRYMVECEYFYGFGYAR